MTKSTRHKKQRKQEKAKTQLTGVRKLGKAQNVVEPTLRVKKILIREQLKTGSLLPDNRQSTSGLKQSTSSQASVITEDEESYTRRRQSVQDLLSTSNHHNVNMRKDALVGLHEIAMSHFNTILRNLDRILTKIASVASDKEGAVRKENLKLAECVFSKISENQLRPFWSMLVAHLKCALTHLIASVRYSALSFIELLVDYHSNLISESSAVILPSILCLISTTSKDSKKSGPTSNSQKTNKSSSSKNNITKLKVEITGKNDDTVGRLKVLRMLSKCLSISSTNLKDSNQVSVSRRRDNGGGKSIPPTNYLGMRYPVGYCWDQTEETDMMEKYCLQGLASNSTYSSRFYSTLTADPFSSPFAADSNHRSSDFWIEFLSSCIPVLIETWVELGPTSSQPSASYGNSDRKSMKRKMKYGGPSEIGSDKDNTAGRRNGLHILNETNVDNILCITTLFEQLLHMNGINLGSGASNSSNSGTGEQSVKTVQKAQGQNMAKYFFHLMPYVSLHESRRKDVISVNLKLFKIAGELKMFDKEMKKKLQIFMEGAMERRTLDRDHCKQTLGIMNFIDSTQMKSLCTEYLMFASKFGHFDIVATYLSNLINLTIPITSHSKGIQELVSNVQWEEIISELIQNWSVTVTNGQIQTLLELLTFVALRRLANMQTILQNHIGKLKELLNAATQNNPSPSVWESIYRTFSYSEASSSFKTEFANMYPADLVLV